MLEHSIDPPRFVRPIHQAIYGILGHLNAGFLRQYGILFGGGTRIAMSLHEFRESVDLDLLCPSVDAYRAARQTVTNRSFGKLVNESLVYKREVLFDRDGIRTFVCSGDLDIKVEVIAFFDYRLAGQDDSMFPVPVLDRTSCFVTKLLANSDRGRAVPYKDVIDLLMMEREWGPIPAAAWREAERHYGPSVRKDYQKSVALLSDLNDSQIREVAQRLIMDARLLGELRSPPANTVNAELSSASGTVGANVDQDSV